MIKNIGIQFQPVRTPSGVEDLASLITFLSDRKALEKYFKELTDMIDAANKAVAMVGKAKDIDKFLESAQSKDDQAKIDADKLTDKASKVLIDAKSQADRLVTEAEESVKALIEITESDLAAQTEKIDKRDKETKESQATLSAREESVSRKEKIQAETTASLESLQVRLTKQKKEIERKTQILKQLELVPDA